jgi:hypothetical protein
MMGRRELLTISGWARALGGLAPGPIAASRALPTLIGTQI